MKSMDEIRDTILAAFLPTYLDIEDQSDRHAGHYDGATDGPTHLKIEIKSARFNGLSPVKRHQLVYQALDEALKTGLHAIQLVLHDDVG